MRALFLVVVAGLLPGCASSRTARAPEGRGVRLEVPFFPDGTDQCGPSALASLLGYWGKPALPAELRAEIYRANLKGALTVDMLLAAKRRGLSAEMVDGSIAFAQAELDAGRPVLAFINVGLRVVPIGHYLVLTGYDEERRTFFAHSGKRRDLRISYAKLDGQWEKTNRWTLKIMPPA